MVEKSYFINGITELLILSLLNKCDSYVYEITKQIEKCSNNCLSISQNTIYAATYKLKNENKISEYSKLVGKRRTRIYYHIEDAGKNHLFELMQQYSQTIAGVENVLSTLNQKEDDSNEQNSKAIH